MVLVFAVRGLLSGFLNQIFAVTGLLVGLWIAGWSSQWVASHWLSAQPAFIFWLMRWGIAVSAGLAVAALFQWWGSLLSKAFESTPIGWLDRPGGFVMGAALGVFISSVVLLGLLVLPWSGRVAETAARSRTARPVMTSVSAACVRAAHFVPGSAWLGRRFQAASSRVERRAQALSRAAF